MKQSKKLHRRIMDSMLSMLRRVDGQEPDLPVKQLVRRKIPRSWFTQKRTMGRRAEFYRSVSLMPPNQQAAALRWWGEPGADHAYYLKKYKAEIL
jgi:hypothetical protein